jgi:hypothetical protein
MRLSKKLKKCSKGQKRRMVTMDLHPNTKWLIEWADRMNEKFGPPRVGLDWCRKLAYKIGEQGMDHPSNKAIRVAEYWEHAYTHGSWKEIEATANNR